MKEAIREDKYINECDYIYLVKLVTKYILNGNFPPELDKWEEGWDSKKVTVVDNGDYQGTQLFLIPMDTYQPCEFEYLLTYVGYGSCSGCDTLMHIQHSLGYSDELPNEEQVKVYMELCKDLVTNMVKPYNCGWREDTLFDHVKMEG